MKLVWAKQAVRDLVEARIYVELGNPKAAAELGARIVAATERLMKHPEFGRSGRLSGTRELFVSRTRYFITYRIYRDRIELLRILHTGRQYPPPS